MEWTRRECLTGLAAAMAGGYVTKVAGASSRTTEIVEPPPVVNLLNFRAEGLVMTTLLRDASSPPKTLAVDFALPVVTGANTHPHFPTLIVPRYAIDDWSGLAPTAADLNYAYWSLQDLNVTFSSTGVAPGTTTITVNEPAASEHIPVTPKQWASVNWLLDINTLHDPAQTYTLDPDWRTKPYVAGILRLDCLAELEPAFDKVVVALLASGDQPNGKWVLVDRANEQKLSARPYRHYVRATIGDSHGITVTFASRKDSQTKGQMTLTPKSGLKDPIRLVDVPAHYDQMNKAGRRQDDLLVWGQFTGVPENARYVPRLAAPNEFTDGCGCCSGVRASQTLSRPLPSL